MEVCFWSLLVLTTYSYALFPPLAWLLARIAGRGWVTGAQTPSLTVVVSAHNEEAVIADKLCNTLEQDYPPDLLEVVVSSDGSTDRTDEVVAAISDRRLRLRRFPRLGKTACLNRVVPESRGEIVIFTDANAFFPDGLLRALVRSFADPEVGLVTGSTRYRPAEGLDNSTGLYARLEHYTKLWESQVSSCVGADGAVFAMRRSLFRELASDDINDLVLPLRVVEDGHRVILDPDAGCFETATDADAQAFRRQVRISARTIRALGRHLSLLDPHRFGTFAFFLLSHKVLRLLAPFFFMGALGTNVLLLTRSTAYVVPLMGFGVFLAAGLVGLTGRSSSRLVSLCKTLLLTLAAQAIGWWRVLSSRQDTLWTPQR
jgi:cellulose synthase/poly-beta-1,6-N-acetylglucosamine synthase-like glycosyltransferase